MSDNAADLMAWSETDAAKNSAECHAVAIAALRERLEASRVVIGDCTLYCEDCEFVLPTLGKVDAVVTDPPYGIGFSAQPTKWQRNKGFEPTYWDEKTVSLETVLNKSDVCVVWGGNYYKLPPSRGWMCWYKPDAPPSMSNCEFAWTSIDKNARLVIQSIGATNKERVGHPTQKPIKVMIESILYTGDASTILDPFMGSGTTGVACVQMGRKFIGIERERRYFDAACRRIEKAYAQPRLDLPEPPPPATPQPTFFEADQ